MRYHRFGSDLFYWKGGIMQNINSELYRTNIFYRDLVDKMLANEKEQKIRQLELEQQLRQRQAECERLQAELGNL